MSVTIKTQLPRCLLIGVLLGLNGGVAAPAGAGLYVGVLEDLKTFDLQDAVSGTPHVRVAFKKDGNGWLPVSSNREVPAEMQWAVVFNGKRIGTIKSRNPNSIRFLADRSTQAISAKSTVPRVITGSSDFSYSEGEVNTRPLLLVSSANFRDPEGWKPTTLSASDVQLAITELRRQVPTVEQCDEAEGKITREDSYSDGDVHVLKAYRSRDNELIFGVQLDADKSNCGFFDDEHFYSYWFAIGRHKDVDLLGSQLMPLDAADLDGGGRTEWVFQSSRGEDEDGYELFYNDFAQHAYFRWTYH